MRKIVILGLVLLVTFAVVEYLFFSGDTSDPKAQLQRMSPAEREYCLDKLGKINANSTAADVEVLLGKPSRDLVLKKNWWVTFGDHKARSGVYFSTEGHATEVVLDGDGYYYRRKVPPATNKSDLSKT
jgi:hypothetical protein